MGGCGRSHIPVLVDEKMITVEGVLVIWLLMWLFNKLAFVSQRTKDIVNSVVIIILVLVLVKVLKVL